MILQSNALHLPLRDASVQCVVTSPPYWGLRDYGVEGQFGLERTPEEYVANMVSVFREVRRVLREDGTCWVNLGDCYGSGTTKDRSPTTIAGLDVPASWSNRSQSPRNGLKPKDLIGIPWRVAFALQADGWYLRSDIIWAKPNPMPESVTDRPTKAHEYLFLLTKSARYYYDAEAVKEAANPNDHNGVSVKKGGFNSSWANDVARKGDESFRHVSATRNLRSVWTIATQPYPEAHFATFPEEIPKRCILAGTSARGACANCGAPWERNVSTSYANPGNRTTNGPRSTERRHETAGFSVRLEKRTSTLDWKPTCQCYAGWESSDRSEDLTVRPSIVLDPFAGSGTTVAVAESLGRRGVGLELKPEYIRMAQKRCQVTLGLPL